MTRACFLSILILLMSLVRSQARDFPVMAGGNAVESACSLRGEVVGLDPYGDGFLSVRSGPGGRQFLETDRVFNGQSVAICEQRGSWLGVVYGAPGLNCELDAPRSIRQPYTGPCRSGWVYSRYVHITGAALGRRTGSNEESRSIGEICNRLWISRNLIYKQAGYCFKTARAIQSFGNAGCRYDAVEETPLSDRQRKEILQIKSRELALACPR